MSTPPVFHLIASAPRPVAPYSHAVEVEGWVFLTGQIPNDPDDPAAPIPDGIEAQTRRTMENLRRVLAALGLGFEHVVAARVFLTHFDEDYQRMNAVYERYFRGPSAPDAREAESGSGQAGADRAPGRLPARTCVGVTALALGVRVEIDLIARRP